MYPLGRKWGSISQGVVNEGVHSLFLMTLSTSACITQQAAAGGGTSVRLGAPVSRFQQDSWKVARYQSPWIELSPSASTSQSLLQFLPVFKGVMCYLSRATAQTWADCKTFQCLSHHPSKQRGWKPPHPRLSKTLRRKLCWSTDLTYIAVQSQI